MAVEQYTSQAFDILLTVGIIRLGSFKGNNIGAQLTGSGTTQGTSDWKLVQSNDAINWVDVTGATFTDIADETLSFEVADVYNMLYIGLQRVSAGTETTGTVQLKIVFKD